MRLSPKGARWFLITDHTQRGMIQAYEARANFAERNGLRQRVAVLAIGKLLIAWDRDAVKRR